MAFKTAITITPTVERYTILGSIVQAKLAESREELLAKVSEAKKEIEELREELEEYKSRYRTAECFIYMCGYIYKILYRDL